jgi:hypothetical protein
MNLCPNTFKLLSLKDHKLALMALLHLQLRLGLNETVSLILGGRVENEKQDRDVTAWPGTSWGGQVITDTSDTLFLPKAGVDFTLNNNSSLGVTLRKGYTPGGGALDWDNGDFYEYDKEEVTTLEVSSRNSLLGGIKAVMWEPSHLGDESKKLIARGSGLLHCVIFSKPGCQPGTQAVHNSGDFGGILGFHLVGEQVFERCQ